MAANHETRNMALFCDFENVALGVRDAKYEKFDIGRVLERLLLKGSIVVKKAYCDWERYKEFKAGMHGASFELIEIPHVRQSGKNSADIRMVVDALDLCYTKGHVDTFVIISGDSDFSPLVSKLRENAKVVIGIGVKNSSSDLLIANCDEFIYYDDLVREDETKRRASKKRKEAGPAGSDKQHEAFDLVIETLQALIAERGEGERVWGSMIKQALKRRNPGFNESYYGFKAFSDLLEEAEKRKLITLARDEKSGGYLIRPAARVKLCRYDNDRLGLVEGDDVLDVSAALDAIPAQRWPIAPGDPLIANLARVCERAGQLAAGAPRRKLSAVSLKSPVANPGKIVNAPINYQKHIDEAKADPKLGGGRKLDHITDWGLFLKATSALIGPGEPIRLRMPERRNDHEVELAVVIGRECRRATEENALEFVAGYAIGLDMTIRGPEMPSWRKSADTYAVCGPWLTTKDEVPDPNNLRLCLKVNGETRQDSSTARMVYNVHKLIAYATSMYTLHPGDLIFSGTPEGVGPVKAGDVITAEIERVGRFDIRVAAYEP